MFDRVRVISLPRRADRREALDLSQLGLPWEFVDGLDLDPPENWWPARGHYGCRQAHLRELRLAAKADESILLLEDDVVLHPDFAREVASFTASLASLRPWEGLWLGGEHALPPYPGDGPVLRCRATWRTHAYALRGQFLHHAVRTLERAGPNYLDAILSAMQGDHFAYAPTEWLAGVSGDPTDTGSRSQPPAAAFQLA